MTAYEYKQILKMVEDGQISAEEGIRLISTQREVAKAAPVAASGGAKRWLRVRVTDTATGRPKVTINLPMSLVKAGLSTAAQFETEVNLAEIAEAVTSGDLEGKLVDVLDEEDGEHVEIFVD